MKRTTTLVPWKEEHSCSETALLELARKLALELEAGHRVLLQGPLGAGKTTFARALLEALGVTQPPEGSPSFAIAHEYFCPKGEVVHLDLYRVQSEQELDEAGVPAYFWERSVIAITEWTSLFPEFESQIEATGPSWIVELAFGQSPELRSVRIQRTAEA